MARCLPTALDHTQRQLVLAAWDGIGTHPASQQLLFATAAQPCWRIVEAASRAKSPAPFELHLAWGAGGLAIGSARITVSRATRIAVFARSLEVSVANLFNAENTVAAAVADSDSFVQTHNQWEERGTFTDDQTLTLDIPPFATHVRLDCGDKDALPDLRLRLLDGQGLTRLHLPADQLPQDGLPVGGAHSAQISHVAAGTVWWRLVFLLSL